jgi:tetratricopeptide (TPR) repeat protein
VQLTNSDDPSAACDRVRALLDDGRPAEAIAFAEQCTGPERLVEQVLALACTHGGAMLRDRNQLLRGTALWKQAGAYEQTGLGYNLANSELDLWDLAISEHGFVQALQDHRSHLQNARELLRRAGSDEQLAPAMRVQALTNLANSYDGMGRDVDALAAYEQALALDPDFGMAPGNKALTLLGIAAFAGQHQPTLLVEALEAFDAALQDRERVIHIGGSRALKSFEDGRARIKPPASGETSTGHRDRHAEWRDPYLAWCAQHGLFLHVSMQCLSETYEELDPLFFRGVTVGLSDEEQRRAMDLLDAFNAVKQDYLAARYLLWLADGDSSPIRAHAAAISRRAGFLDSLRYARWGVRTGVAVQAFAAATNLLDKVACLVHLYYRTSRKTTGVSFRYLWHPRTNPNKPDVMDAELADTAETRGLRALCDLSCDLETATPLNELIERRHSATHRFLTVHAMHPGVEADEGDWLDRVEWPDLLDGALRQLKTARSAVIYLARTIDIAESKANDRRRKQAAEDATPVVVPPLPVFRAVSEDSEFD